MASVSYEKLSRKPKVSNNLETIKEHLIYESSSNSSSSNDSLDTIKSGIGKSTKCGIEKSTKYSIENPTKITTNNESNLDTNLDTITTIKNSDEEEIDKSKKKKNPIKKFFNKYCNDYNNLMTPYIGVNSFF